MIVLDSGVLIDHLRQFEPATAFMTSLRSRPMCSEVTRIEILQGLRPAEREITEDLLALIGWAEVSERIARRAGELGRLWRASHPGIGVADLAIAATAQELNAELATTNPKHFPMFPGLTAPY